MTHNDLINVLKFLNRGNEWVVDDTKIREWNNPTPKPTDEEIRSTLESKEFKDFVDTKNKEAEERAAKLSQNTVQDGFAELIKVMGLDINDPKLSKLNGIVSNIK